MTPPSGGVVILGPTSAIARAVAGGLAAKGHALVLAGRDAEEIETIAADLRIRHGVPVHGLNWDATDFDTHAERIEACAELLDGSIEGVVLCSGYMPEQEVAQTDWDAARRTIDVTYTGSVSMLNLFATRFESQRRGFICAIGSVAGDRGRQSNYLYGSAKAGLSAYLEGLRNRMFHAGVHVLTVKPGFVDTAMTWGLDGMFLVASPETVGRRIVRAIEKRRNVLYVPWFWRYIMLIIRHIPESVFKRMRM